MAVPTIITDLSSTAALNSPAGTDAIGNTLDDYLRSTQAILKAQFSAGTAISVTGATMTVPVTGSYFSVTGSGTISVTGLSTNFAGRVATLYFADGNLTLVNGASLVLPGGANIACAAGDIAVMVNETGSSWRCVSYTPAVSVTAKRYIATATSDIQAQLNALSTSIAAIASVPSGCVQYFAMSTAPAGWLEANGSAVSRTTYASLFAAISTTYGVGDGATTFNLPDLRGQFLRGWDHSAGIDTGRTFGSSQSDAFQGHYHNIGVYSQPMGSGGGGNVVGWGSATGAVHEAITDGTNGTPRTAAETRPKNVAMLPCIKT